MKKSKSRLLAKEARRSAANNIKAKLIAELNDSIKNFGDDSKKLRRLIEKQAKKLAKKISGKLKLKTPNPVAYTVKAPVVKADTKPKVRIPPLASAPSDKTNARVRTSTEKPKQKTPEPSLQ